MHRLLGVPFEPAADSRRAADVFDECVGPPGLYVHIPFCSKLCPFCPYNKVPFQPHRAAEYLEQMRWELGEYASAAKQPFTSLYVGGGTPTLCRQQLGMLADVPVAGERAIEVLPSHMTPRVAGELRELGFNYVSVGVQSFHDPVLRHLQRPTSAATNRRAVEVARAGFECVDVDLIFDVAYDGPDLLLADLSEAFGYGVDQVSTYPLMRFGYTPFGKARHDRRAEHAVLARAAELAGRSGYHRDSVWTFVRDGSDTYTSITRPYFIGVGAGAATFTGRSFAVNHFGLDQYGEAVHAGRLPIALMTTLPRPLARAYRGFWQAYTGTIAAPRQVEPGDPVSPGETGGRADGEDELLVHPSIRAALAVARTAGWVSEQGDGYGLTTSGYDRYHDLERWVTYHLIEPLWSEMMTEHPPADLAGPTPGLAGAGVGVGGGVGGGEG